MFTINFFLKIPEVNNLLVFAQVSYNVNLYAQFMYTFQAYPSI